MGEPANKKGTLLIVDDEPNVLWFISKVFQPMGYETLTAGSGLEGLKVVQECGDKLDLVLLDLRMPGMGGMEVLESIRKHQPDLPVIVLSAVHDKQGECEKLGVEAFIKKPYSLEELYEKVASVIQSGRLAKESSEVPAGMEPSAKLLIVDDDAEVCELLCNALIEDVTDMYFQVKWAKSGAEALELSQTFEPEIAVIDIKMAGMWGDELVKRFKSGEGHCPKDFVIYTRMSGAEEADHARRLGYKFLTKPTDLDTLIDALRKVCVRHQLFRPKNII